MNRHLILSAAAAVCLLSASCRFLHLQKTPDSVSQQQDAPQSPEQTSDGAPVELQVAAPGQTEQGKQSEAVSPVPGGLTPAAPVPDLPFVASPASVPMPGAFELPSPSAPGERRIDDADELPALPQPTPSAELRGLRSPQLPSNLPMSLDGKIRSLPSH